MCVNVDVCLGNVCVCVCDERARVCLGNVCVCRWVTRVYVCVMN